MLKNHLDFLGQSSRHAGRSDRQQHHISRTRVVVPHAVIYVMSHDGTAWKQRKCYFFHTTSDSATWHATQHRHHVYTAHPSSFSMLISALLFAISCLHYTAAPTHPNILSLTFYVNWINTSLVCKYHPTKKYVLAFSSLK